LSRQPFHIFPSSSTGVVFDLIYSHNGCLSRSLQERVCVSEEDVEECLEIEGLGSVSGRCFDAARLSHLCKVE